MMTLRKEHDGITQDTIKNQFIVPRDYLVSMFQARNSFTGS